MYVFATTSVVK